MNPGNVDTNVLEISGNGIDVSYELINTSILDISFLELGQTYSYNITSSYLPTLPDEFIVYNTQTYRYNLNKPEYKPPELFSLFLLWIKKYICQYLVVVQLIHICINMKISNICIYVIMYRYLNIFNIICIS